MATILELPTDPLASAAVDLARSTESESVFNHSVRSYMWALLLAEHENLTQEADYDQGLLFAATVMHDLGTGSRATGRERFEVEGADLAATLLTQQGVPSRDVDRVWEAIAIHTSGGIAERRGVLAYLTREGVGVDFGRGADIVDHEQRAVHARYPRLSMVRSLVDAIVEKASRNDAAAPRYTTPGELLRERRENGITRMELAAADSVWGD
ncbi:HD domain-containing protein [Tsukamurella sp. 8F]|uniref:HD domain-containing protein n=1 Tax=unclassified Tsukamurella TaxID=2633480 RepID=UPI0023B8A379|nr:MULTISPECIES: HD domain-containing protein [unclassified Tsukamurella]MDF0529774.1 HD domain-containing protein [Tsukamurella sp. 8J]MDF0586966.1 HD domain-containing protein [Tsukamurella sp. 8F]